MLRWFVDGHLACSPMDSVAILDGHLKSDVSGTQKENAPGVLGPGALSKAGGCCRSSLKPPCGVAPTLRRAPPHGILVVLYERHDHYK